MITKMTDRRGLCTTGGTLTGISDCVGVSVTSGLSAADSAMVGGSMFYGSSLGGLVFSGSLISESLICGSTISGSPVQTS